MKDMSINLEETQYVPSRKNFFIDLGVWGLSHTIDRSPRILSGDT